MDRKRKSQAGSRLGYWAVSLIMATTAWSAAAGAQSRSSFVAFQAFLGQTRTAQSADYLGRGRMRVRDDDAFQEMKRYVLDHYEGVRVTHSFIDSGHMVDCVPFDQQPGLRGASDAEKRAARTPPGKAAANPRMQEPRPGPGYTRSLDLTLHAGKRDAAGNDMSCPRATIPMRRVTLQDVARFPTLSAFLHAGKIDDGSLDHRPPKLPADGGHYYARSLQFVDNLGGDAWLNVWSPTVEDGDMSLAQLWVVGSEGDDKQTVEAGWQVYPDKWDSKQAALFIYYTPDNYRNGCYNLECDGFVQIANNIYLGKGFDHYSSTNGGQWGFNLQWKRATNGNWWLFYKGPGDYIAVGYYKSSLFAKGTLANKAEKIAFGGEDTAVPKALQMGSGEKASAGWAHAAFMNKIFYIDTNAVSQWNNLTAQEVVHDCYTTDIHNIFGEWGTYLFFGGPSCNVRP